MNKMFAKVIITLWTLLVLLNLVIPKSDFSESENRYLADFPIFSYRALVNGRFMPQVDEYINDHFIGRDVWITSKSQLEYFISKRENNGVFVCNNQLIEDIKPPDNEIVAKNIAGLKNYATIYQKPVFIMIVPSASSIQSDRLPLYATYWDQKQFLSDTDMMLDNKVKLINIYDTFSTHKDDYIFYRTDHHWTTDGAFLAYQELCKLMKLTSINYENYQFSVITNDFKGTLYSKSGYRNISPDIIKSYEIGEIIKYTIQNGDEVTEYNHIYFPDFLSKKDKYSYFLNGNQQVVRIYTKSKTNKKLLMFKDSYSHCFVPFLLQDYSEITLIDLRYVHIDIQQLIDVNQYDDTMFLFSMDMFTHRNDLSKLSWMK